MYKKILLLTLSVLAAFGAQAQEEETFKGKTGKAYIPFYFRLDSDVFDPAYKDNQISLTKIAALSVDERIHVDSVVMVATSSPEGTDEYNTALAHRRSRAISVFFKNNFPEFQSLRDSISLHTWSEVAEAVQKDMDVPHREYVLQVLSDGKGDLTLPRRLRSIDGGVAYSYIEEHYLSRMRSAANAVIYYQSAEQQPEVQVQYVPCPEKETIYRFVTVDAKYPILALRTNLLCPLTNIGIEVPINNRWSVAADWYTPWVFRTFDKTHKWAFQAQAASVEGRYWFGKKHNSDPDNREYRMTGHSAGVYVYGGKYDLEKNWEGHQGEFYSVGVDYLYSIPAWKNRIRWEFELAVGYLHNGSYAYDVLESGGQLIARSSVHKHFNYVGPTKISVSLVVPIFKHYNKTVKEVVE